jgi:hypothetical protein
MNRLKAVETLHNPWRVLITRNESHISHFGKDLIVNVDP